MKIRYIINYVTALLLILSLNSCRTSEVFNLGTLDCPPFSVEGYKVKSRDIRMGFFVTFYFDRKGRLLNYQYNNIFFSDGKDDIELGDCFNPSGNYLWGLASNSKAGRNMFVNWLAHAGIEGSEEGIGDVLNQISDYAINDTKGQTQYQIDTEDNMAQGMDEEAAKKAAGKTFLQNTLMDTFAGAVSGGNFNIIF